MQSFYALITVMDSPGYPAHPIAPGGPPPSIWPSPGRPEHPIFYPPGIWGPTDPRPGWGLPGQPPGIWGGANEPFPTPPIVIIPPTEPGKPPLVIWGPGDPRPTPPIELPGGGNPPPGGEPVKIIEWKTAWTPQTGWIVVGVPQVPHPAPAKK